MAAPRTLRLRYQLLVFSVIRTIINTGFRMLYPFLPTFARGLGVDLSAVALAVTARSSVGLAAPIFGSIFDVRSRRSGMLIGLTLFAAGLAVVWIWPSYPAFFAALMLSGLGKAIFDPAMQAYLGDRVAYSRRGLALAVVEFGWSAAFLVGVPLMGWLIAVRGWQAPFPVLAGLSLLAGAAIWYGMGSAPAAPVRRSSALGALGDVLRRGPAIAGLSLGFLISTANEAVNIVYGAWMESAFGLQVAALGAASIVIGAAELGGEGFVAGLTDRLGKRRAVGAGLVCTAAACLALPLLGRELGGALLGLFFFYLTFEFTVVSTLPLMTELVPAARATLMASNVAGFSAGRAIGAIIGPPLFGYGLLANGILAAALNLAALVILFAFVRID